MPWVDPEAVELGHAIDTQRIQIKNIGWALPAAFSGVRDVLNLVLSYITVAEEAGLYILVMGRYLYLQYPFKVNPHRGFGRILAAHVTLNFGSYGFSISLYADGTERAVTAHYDFTDPCELLYPKDGKDTLMDKLLENVATKEESTHIVQRIREDVQKITDVRSCNVLWSCNA